VEERHIQWQHSKVMKAERHASNYHKSCVLWLTGLSASGKSSLAYEVERLLFAKQVNTYVLDGDNLRHGLNADLGFQAKDRSENIRRTAEVAKLMVDAGLITLLALISPYRVDREMARAIFQPEEFIEVYIDCPLNVCEQRDPKGLYKKARSGVIQSFTGITAPYEPPLQPEITIPSNLQSLQQSAMQILDYLSVNRYIV
jgi:adenylylsulfate kinase